MTKRQLWFVLTIAALAAAGARTLAAPSPAASSPGAEEVMDPRAWFTPEHASARLLMLGTFHFKDAGLDSYQPEVDVDITSAPRQAELAELLDRLAAFAPTKVLVEWDADRQAALDERYEAYLAGDFELGPNEIYQVGFRLARRLGHERLYGVDVSGRPYPDLPADREAYAALHDQSDLLESPWDERYEALYRSLDHAKARQTLSEHLLYLNGPEWPRLSHGHYILRGIGLGVDDEYPGADHLTGWWYNRNLRIVANIVRVTAPGDRLFLLIGAGHLSILLHAFEASPEYDLVEVAEVLTPVAN